MRFLADESCDFAVVRALRIAGHDVHAVAELLSGLDDAAVMSLALRERRVLLTEDKDFGQLVYANTEPSGGVIFIRYPAGALTRIIHEHFCCNRRSAATTSLRSVGSPLGPSTYCTSTPQVLKAPRAALATRLSDFATNRHE